MRSSLLLIAAVVINACSSSEVEEFHLNADSVSARELLESASLIRPVETPRNLEDEEWNKEEFLGRYSIKFQSCTVVSEWNGANNDSSSNSTIVSKQLVSFRMCNSRSCSHSSSKGCLSQYGDYIVDINTFVYYYLTALKESNTEIALYCAQKCGSQNNDCYSGCFSDKGGISMGQYKIDPFNYAQCKQYGNYYIGPMCSSNGSQINLGLFADSSCTVPSSCDSSCFYKAYSFYLPYSTASLVSNACLTCADSSNGDSSSGSSRSECKSIYETSGKCEAKLPIDYPNSSACTFITGIQNSKGGVIKGATMRNKETSVLIGMLSFSTILLAVYTSFVFKKYERAKILLASDNYTALLEK